MALSGTVLLATQLSDFTIHWQSDSLGVGGRVVEASQNSFSAGQSRGWVFEGL